MKRCLNKFLDLLIQFCNSIDTETIARTGDGDGSCRPETIPHERFPGVRIGAARPVSVLCAKCVDGFLIRAGRFLVVRFGSARPVSVPCGKCGCWCSLRARRESSTPVARMTIS